MFIAGQKNIFAIEFNIDANGIYPFGNIRIWLDSSYVGFYDDEVQLLVTLNALKRLPELFFDDLKNPLESIESFFLKINSGEIPDGDKYRISLGESFDDFSIVGFRNGDLIYFIWKIHDKTFFSYPSYSNAINSAIVPIGLFNETLLEFERLIGRPCKILPPP